MHSASTYQGVCILVLQRAQEKLQLARNQRNRLLAAFEGVSAAEDDMEAVIARYAVHAVHFEPQQHTSVQWMLSCCGCW